MIVQRFVKWCETANSRQRAEGVSILARAFVENRVADTDREQALAALTLALDDPSPKVRLRLAETLAASPRAPRQIVLALAGDTDEIGCLVAELSPVLSDSDLVDLAATGGTGLQRAIAERSEVSLKLAAALAEVGDQAACAALLANPGARIAPSSHLRIAERHGDDAEVRGLMLERDDIPVDVRQTLILHLGQALIALPLVGHSVGAARASRIVFDACEQATAALADTIRADEVPAFVEHLRISGQLSTAFLIRTVCAGNIDLFAAALVALSGLSEKRVRAIVVDGRESAFNALVQTCGLPAAAAPLLRTAVQVWKLAIVGGGAPDADEIAAEVMTRLAAAFRGKRDEAGFEAVEALLNRLEAETLRASARQRAKQLAAA